MLRLQLEMREVGVKEVEVRHISLPREEIEAFGESSGSFEEQVLVSYALDHNIPEEMALAPEVYAGGS